MHRLLNKSLTHPEADVQLGSFFTSVAVLLSWIPETDTERAYHLLEDVFCFTDTSKTKTKVEHMQVLRTGFLFCSAAACLCGIFSATHCCFSSFWTLAQQDLRHAAGHTEADPYL